MSQTSTSDYSNRCALLNANLNSRPADSQDLQIPFADELKFYEGCVVWAKVEGHSWCLGIVGRDPESGQFRMKVYYTSKVKFHVIFFGNVQNRAWCNYTSICSYERWPPIKFLKSLSAFVKKFKRSIGTSNQWSVRLDMAEEANAMQNLQHRIAAFATWNPIPRQRKKVLATAETATSTKSDQVKQKKTKTWTAEEIIATNKRKKSKFGRRSSIWIQRAANLRGHSS